MNLTEAICTEVINRYVKKAKRKYYSLELQKVTGKYKLSLLLTVIIAYLKFRKPIKKPIFLHQKPKFFDFFRQGPPNSTSQCNVSIFPTKRNWKRLAIRRTSSVPPIKLLIET